MNYLCKYLNQYSVKIQNNKSINGDFLNSFVLNSNILT